MTSVKIQERDRLLDVNQVAQRLNVGRTTVYRLIESGDLPASRFGTAHCIRVREKDVVTFIEKRFDTDE